MLAAVAFCPHPPLLVPDLAQAAASELDELRAACRAAITRLAAPGRRFVLLGAGPSSKSHGPRARGTFAGYGVPLELALGSGDAQADASGGAENAAAAYPASDAASTAADPVELPLSLTVGAWLLRDALGPNTGAVGFSIGPDAACEHWTRFVTRQRSELALIVMGDGSARRSTAAPGYFDDRAESYDAAVAHALHSGAGDLLKKCGAGPGPDLLAAGAPVWQAVAGDLDTGTWDAELLYNDAPYGVGYFVATWLATATSTSTTTTATTVTATTVTATTAISTTATATSTAGATWT